MSFTTHGLSNTPENQIWRSMKDRCNNPRNYHFKYYGGRGIKVCERWSLFINFYNDMGKRPTPEHSIDRINNSGNYEPNNCKWSTKLEQTKNRRITILPQVCRHCGKSFVPKKRTNSHGKLRQYCSSTCYSHARYGNILTNEICLVKGCTRKRKKKGLCNMHYLRQWKKINK